jgi:hypothetical protein
VYKYKIVDSEIMDRCPRCYWYIACEKEGYRCYNCAAAYNLDGKEVIDIDHMLKVRENEMFDYRMNQMANWRAIE